LEKLPATAPEIFISGAVAGSFSKNPTFKKSPFWQREQKTKNATLKFP
jgi:hypothetical protein